MCDMCIISVKGYSLGKNFNTGYAIIVVKRENKSKFSLRRKTFLICRKHFLSAVGKNDFSTHTKNE